MADDPYEALAIYFVRLPTGGYVHFRSQAEQDAYLALEAAFDAPDEVPG